MTYPENLQEIAFNAFDEEEAIYQPTQDFRFNVAKRILSAVGFTEPKPKSELEIIKEEVKNLVQRIKKLEYGGEA